MEKLNQQLKEVYELIPERAKTNPAISKVSVGWQLSHSLKTILKICLALENSKPAEFRKEFKLLKWIFLTLAWFPRGKGKAPKVVQPEGDITEKSILELLAKTKESLTKVEGLANDHFFSHPYFGNIAKKEAIRFLVVHTNHHLKIAREICKAD